MVARITLRNSSTKLRKMRDTGMGRVDSERTSANWSWDSDAELWLIHGVSFPLPGVRPTDAGKGKLTPPNLTSTGRQTGELLPNIA